MFEICAPEVKCPETGPSLPASQRFSRKKVHTENCCYARDAPETPAEELLTEDERTMIGAFVERRRLRPSAERGTPFGTDIRSWVVMLARMVGWRPTKRHPNPGNEVLWRAYVRLQTMVLGMQTLRGS